MATLEIFEKRLLIISGKGGVGKSTLCAAFALAAARLGKRVLVVEMDEKERIPRLFGTPEVGYEGAYVHPNIYARNLLPTYAMDEFVQMRVSMKTLARQILQSPIYKYFVAAAPGLKEFVTLGKIMLLEEEKNSDGEPKYDLDASCLEGTAGPDGAAMARPADLDRWVRGQVLTRYALTEIGRRDQRRSPDQVHAPS